MAKKTLSELAMRFKKTAVASKYYTDEQVGANEVKLFVKATPNTGFLKTYIIAKGHDTVLVSDVGFEEAVISDINEQVRHRIISTLTWNDKPVWLSTENQMDWKAAYDLAVQTSGANLPVKFKLGEQPDGTPVYHTFQSVNSFGNFHAACVSHIQTCLAAGWAEKDAIDWTQYQ